MPQIVAYYRVSTRRQGRSGLGLETQRERCEAFAAANGFTISESFVEAGKGSDALDRRLQLAAALAPAGASGAPSWSPSSIA